MLVPDQKNKETEIPHASFPVHVHRLSTAYVYDYLPKEGCLECARQFDSDDRAFYKSHMER